MCFRKLIEKLMNGPFHFLAGFVDLLLFEPLDDLGAITMILFLMGFGATLATVMMYLSRMM